MKEMFTLAEAVSACGGTLIDRNSGLDGSYPVYGVSKNSRDISGTDMYVAIKGEKFDGHDFCGQCFDAGVRVFVVNDGNAIPDGAAGILVEDTVKAYGLLARCYRMKLGCKVVGVTGSVGKTSTRHMVALALSAIGRTHMTTLNNNNEIGLPATILSAPADTEYLVVEMGMRGRGQISYLTDIARPDIGIITNIGFCHIELLGSREEIRNAKMEITEGLTKGGTLLVNGDDDFLKDHAVANCPSGFGVAAVSAKGSLGMQPSCFAENIVSTEKDTTFDVSFDLADKKTLFKGVKLNVTGMHNVSNALMGLMCVALFGGDVEKAAAKLAEFEDLKGRGKVTDNGKYIVIDDAYNAAPESVEAAFDKLENTGKGKRKIAVIGGMLELGDSSADLHERIGRSCGRYSFDKIFLRGEYSQDFVRGLLETDADASYEVFEDNEKLMDSLRSYVREGDAVLFKASHGFEFYKLAERLAGEDA